VKSRLRKSYYNIVIIIRPIIIIIIIIIIIHFPHLTAVQPVLKTVPVSLTKQFFFTVLPKTSFVASSKNY